MSLSSILRRQDHGRLPPRLDGAKPLIGHIAEFQTDPVGIMFRGQREHGEAFTIRLLNQDAVVLTGPEANEAFFRAPEEILDPRQAYRIMTPVFGKGIAYDAEPHIMDEQLAFLHPALREANLRGYAGRMVEEAEGYFSRFGESGEFDVLDMGNELTMYTSTRSLLGPDVRKHLDTEFAHLYHDLDSSLTPIAYFFPNLPIPRFIKRNRSRAALVRLFARIVAERNSQGRRDNDMLQALIDARYKDGRKLTDDEITGLLLTIIFAGHHTSGTLTAWSCVEMLQHPQWIHAILAEQEQVIAKHGEAITFDALRDMVTLERVINEAERMHPPIVVMMRTAVQDFRYRDWVMPPGTLMMTSPAVSHRLPEVFKDPNVFDPDRFLPPRAENRAHPYTMISFGGGKHRCIGLHFAYLQIKAILAVLLRRYQLSLASPTYTPNYEFMLVGPKRPCFIRYERRQVERKPEAERKVEAQVA